MSIIHCKPIGSAHIGTLPISFSSPGKQTQSLVPWRRTMRLPSTPISATVASLVISRGPDNIALAILAARTRSCCEAGTSLLGGCIVIALLLYAPEAPACWAELSEELSAEAAANVLPASRILRRLSPSYPKSRSSWVSLLDMLHSFPDDSSHAFISVLLWWLKYRAFLPTPERSLMNERF